MPEDHQPTSRREQIIARPARRRLRGGRVLHDLLRPTRAQLVVALVLCLVAMASVWQMRANREDEAYSSLRRDELIGLLDQLNTSNNDLRRQINRQAEDRRQLQSGADSRKQAERQATRRIQDLSILAGTAPAQGPGIQLVITDPQQKVSPQLLLDAVEEMRDAGAEVIEINEVRVVASTWFQGQPGAIKMGDTLIRSPYTIKVIGQPHALLEGARFRGGLVSRAQAPDVGASVIITEHKRMLITSIHKPTEPRWARPR